MKLFTINSGYFKLDGGAMHGVVPKTMWQKQNPADDENMCRWAMRCLLVVTGNNNILIDTGMGTKQDEKFFSYYHPHGEESIEKNLAKNGYSSDDITDVFLTHLHFDHCGGAIKKEHDQLVPAFSKAKFWSNEEHWQTATHPNEREKASFLKENILPIKESGQLQMVTTNENGEWVTDIEIITVKGHTEAMMLPLIKYHDRKILFCADLLPSVAHISLPWVMAYDMRPLDTLNEKQVILEKAAAENWILFFEHDPKTECCTVQEVNGRVKVKETFSLKEFTDKMESN